MHHKVQPLSRMWSIYVFPYWHLWFVQALLLVFAALVVLESLGALSTFRRFTMVFTVSLMLYLYGPFERQNVLGLENAIYLMPFFLCGLGAHRYRGLLRTRRALIATVVCFIVTQGFHSYIVLTRKLAPIDPVASRSALNLLIGMSASSLAGTIGASRQLPPTASARLKTSSGRRARSVSMPLRFGASAMISVA